MKQRKCRVKNEDKVKEYRIKKIDDHPLLNYEPGLSQEEIEKEEKRFIKSLMQCPKALKAWDKFTAKIKIYKEFPNEMRNDLYLNDSEITKLEVEIIAALESCEEHANQ